MDELTAALKQWLADSYAMALKAQGFHWNVEGKDFHPFHGFFAMIYSDVYGPVDDIAENIRKCGEYAPFTLTNLDRLREVGDKKVNTDPVNMTVDLYDANEVLIKDIDAVFKAATAANEQGIADFAAGRDGVHKKWRWQMRAIIKR